MKILQSQNVKREVVKKVVNKESPSYTEDMTEQLDKSKTQ
jgi:hypothetical protein